MRRKLRLMAPLVVLIAAACGLLEPDRVDLDTNGVVRFVDVEGGCWVIDTPDSTRYEPTSLHAAYKSDGLVVLFRANLRPDLVSICQTGRIVDIVWISTPED